MLQSPPEQPIAFETPGTSSSRLGASSPSGIWLLAKVPPRPHKPFPAFSSYGPLTLTIKLVKH